MTVGNGCPLPYSGQSGSFTAWFCHRARRSRSTFVTKKGRLSAGHPKLFARFAGNRHRLLRRGRRGHRGRIRRATSGVGAGDGRSHLGRRRHVCGRRRAGGRQRSLQRGFGRPRGQRAGRTGHDRRRAVGRTGPARQHAGRGASDGPRFLLGLPTPRVVVPAAAFVVAGVVKFSAVGRGRARAQHDGHRQQSRGTKEREEFHFATGSKKPNLVNHSPRGNLSFPQLAPIVRGLSSASDPPARPTFR